jgi:hypothetical protein
MAANPEDRQTNARDFYREQIVRSFELTSSFAAQTGRVAEDIVLLPEFNAIVEHGKFGSLDTARRIGEMAVVHLDKPGAPSPGLWWRDLCIYERGWFLQAATSDQGPPMNRPRRGVSALSMNFHWAIPDVVERLKTGRAVTEELHRPCTLLFSRGKEGKVYVVEIGGNVEKVFRQTNSLRTVEQIALTAGVSVSETTDILQALATIGAVQLAKY